MMDDLISRQAVLEATSAKLKITGKENAETVYEYIKKLCDDIKALPSAQQWIPCSEMLPMDKGVYLVTDDSGRVARVEKSWFMWCDDGSPFWEYANVTAWMPLPEPYKEEQT